ncbi:MAG TPA: hypothetical protein VN132_11680 [Bdellovibrio sp.]|nr:hypothetical protein [Bdellovibrio sp.]
MKLLLTTILVSLCTLNVYANDNFPQGPDANLTPGALCDHPDAHRYPEGIAYCNRNVDTDTKKSIFVEYDQIGYNTRSMDRGQFKIDHLIPLCMGGGNDIKNLWPQHESVYAITDPLEPLLCEKMAEGKILQKDAVNIILQGKTHLDQIPAIIAKVQAL